MKRWTSTIVLLAWTFSISVLGNPPELAPGGLDKPMSGAPLRGTRLILQMPHLSSLTFVLIPPGEFVMGDGSRADATPLERTLLEAVGQGSIPTGGGLPLRQTTITKCLYVAETKTTTEQFCVFLNDVPDAEQYYEDIGSCTIAKRDGKFRPKADADKAAANTVTYAGAVAYCRWLSANTGLTCRLPTEAEWEWSARGPSGRKFAWGDSLDQVGNSLRQSELASVYSRPDAKTPDGLYGMFGSVGEWCQDWYAETFDRNDKIDPSGPLTGKYKVRRGRGVEAWDRSLGPVTGDLSGGAYGLRVVIETPTDSQDALDTTDRARTKP